MIVANTTEARSVSGQQQDEIVNVANATRYAMSTARKKVFSEQVQRDCRSSPDYSRYNRGDRRGCPCDHGAGPIRFDGSNSVEQRGVVYICTDWRLIMARGKRTADVPMQPPEWVWELAKGTYVPDKEWNVLLKGYETWHTTGARFGSGKGQGVDYKNFGVTLPSVAMSLRRFDEANSGAVVPRDAETYWTAIIMAGAAAICRLRAQRYVSEMEAAMSFGLPSTNITKKAQRYVAKSHITQCPKFYFDKLPEIPVVPEISKQ